MDASGIEVGKCYLVQIGRLSQVRRVLQVMPDDRVLFDIRGANARATYWRAGGLIDVSVFARMAEQEVPCDWTPDTSEPEPR